MAKNGVDANFSALTAWWDGYKYSNPAKRPVLPKPVGFIASVSGSTVSLTWTVSGVSGVSAHIERSPNNNSNFQEIAVKAPGTSDHLDTGRSAITYYYRIRFRWNNLYSDYSDTVIAIVVGAGTSGLQDGGTYTLTVPGAGTNTHNDVSSFLGGANSPIEAAAYNTLFSAFQPPGWDMTGVHGTRVRTERSLNGTKALCHDRTGGLYQFGFLYEHTVPKRTLFYRLSYFFENPNGTGGQLKQIRAAGSTSSGGFGDSAYTNTYLTRNLSGTAILTNNVNSADTYGHYSRLWDAGSYGSFHAEGVWVTLTARVTCNTAIGVADGQWRIHAYREDTGATIGDITDSNDAIWATGGDPLRVQVFQYYMGNGFDNACKCYLDRDIYVASSTTTACPKFLLIGNADTYAACTIKTVAPYLSWEDAGGGAASITFNLNRGRHLSLEGLYLYAMTDVNTPANSSGVAITGT